jgi:LysM repeat protein
MSAWRAFFGKWVQGIWHNPLAVVAAGLIVLSITGYIWLLGYQILPSRDVDDRLSAQLADARKALADRQASQTQSPAVIGTRVAVAQATLKGELSAFVPDSQVSVVIDTLYGAARATGVAVADLQSQSKAGAGLPGLYQVTIVHVQVSGSSRQVLDFGTQLREVLARGVLVSSLGVQGTESASTLSMELSIYSSPFASGQPGTATGSGEATATPTATATATPTQTPIPAGTSTRPPQPSATTASAPTAHPNFTVYIVRRGDTLFSIARRFGTSVAAIKAANGMRNANISVGQRLLIPTR